MQENDHGPVDGTSFRVTDVQEAGIDLLDGAERGVRPRLGRGHAVDVLGHLFSTSRISAPPRFPPPTAVT